ncbi:hypothetical protein [Phaffia rhodozyma]|uniref:Membrane anchor Opy2 N-terminal domain-containing protein n=1 Tax=Phaffia rhodozyma TaxID=264483 RepID=A0A0F7SNN3_PHARH|nr:hypothetical protein [Phaffia rhodozyma]
MDPGFRQRMHVVPAAYKEGSNRLNRRDSVDCPTSAPLCSCSAGYSCVATARTKTTCATVSCVKNSTDDDNGGSINPGLIAGPIIAFLLLCSLTVWWYLRKKKARDLARLAELEERANRLEAAQHEVLSLNTRTPGITPTNVHFGRSSGPDAPESSGLLSSFTNADNRGILSRPNNGRLLTVYSTDGIDLDPATKNSSDHPGIPLALANQDPFADGASFVSGDGFSLLSQATNVIPIAYVPTSGSSPAQSAGRNFRPDHNLGFDLDREDLMSPAKLTTVVSHPGALIRPSALPTPSAPSESDDRLSLMSGAGSFMSFNSNMFVLDTPKIATAQRLNLSQMASKIVPSPSFPHSIDQSPVSQKTNKPTPVRPTTVPKINIGRSPLSQAPVQNYDPNSASSASFPTLPSLPPSPAPLTQSNRSETDMDPFTDDSADTISLPSIHHRYDPRTLSTSFPQQPRFPSDTEDFRFSMDSLAATTSYGGSNFGRPESTASSQGSVMIKSATIVQVGQELQAGSLFRSGSLIRGTQLQAHQQPSDPNSISRQDFLAEQPSSPTSILPPPDRGELFASTSTSNFNSGSSQRDTQYSQYSLGAFDFIPPAPATTPPFPPYS